MKSEPSPFSTQPNMYNENEEVILSDDDFLKLLLQLPNENITILNIVKQYYLSLLFFYLLLLLVHPDVFLKKSLLLQAVRESVKNECCYLKNLLVYDYVI